MKMMFGLLRVALMAAVLTAVVTTAQEMPGQGRKWTAW